MAKYTLSFDETVKGWTSFYSFYPDMMIGMNNSFFTLSEGNLYVHNSEGSVNTFYGTTYPSTVTTIINDSPSDNKIFKAIHLEGTSSWDVAYTTNMTNGTVFENEFENKEEEFYAYLRQSEDTSDTSAMNIQGIGELLSFSGNILTFSYIPETININDALYVYDENTDVLTNIGIIQDISDLNITLDGLLNPIVSGDLAVAVKHNRTEASSPRGYFLKLILTLNPNKKEELFAVNIDSAKSFQ